MAKRSMPVEIIQVKPAGELTKAEPPMPVTIRAQWTLDLRWMDIDNAWAIAWTPNAVCVYWFTKGMYPPALVWLKPDQVKRR